MTAAPAAVLTVSLMTLLATCMATAAAPDARTTAASIHVEQASATASLPGSNVTAAYLTIRNDAAQPDRLLAVKSPDAAMAHLHATTQSGGVNRMRPSDGLDIPAHGSIVLKNGGDHIMLMGLPRPLQVGGTIVLQLTFQRAGDVKVVVPVTPATGN